MILMQYRQITQRQSYKETEKKKLKMEQAPNAQKKIREGRRDFKRKKQRKKRYIEESEKGPGKEYDIDPRSNTYTT